MTLTLTCLCFSDNLKFLNTLNLSYNYLHETADIEHLRLLHALTILDISHNKIDTCDVVDVSRGNYVRCARKGMRTRAIFLKHVTCDVTAMRFSLKFKLPQVARTLFSISCIIIITLLYIFWFCLN